MAAVVAGVIPSAPPPPPDPDKFNVEPDPVPVNFQEGVPEIKEVSYDSGGREVKFVGALPPGVSVVEITPTKLKLSYDGTGKAGTGSGVMRAV
jgi:hypothetical protein